ncbi:accessory gene regulator ArgB-like protein [Anaerocolumna sp. MB42-C2]|uniref:accessory gene regulator ArgB-like protein n=1 Tax=Anaerocolumna sp. MB42-C2 TaxID=3070997 RepID=UPI0027DEC4FF|nr:accessory gene regulator B family protein [Anaerocolumna sp. MB42-C2]WMJ87931.1 accessory gene regulator B family protein [Anaerocolumna sp. MB42-C2]
MLGKVSVSLTNRLIKNNIIKQEDFEIYQFGIENFMMRACHIISYLILGLSFNLLPELLIFLIAFMPLRENSGGYHAKTPLKCYILSCAAIFIFLCLVRFTPAEIMEYSVILSLASSLILFLIVPVESENKPLDDTELTYYKSKAGFIIIIELALVLIFKMLLWNELSFILALSLTFELLVALAGIYFKIYDLKSI